MLCTIFKIDGNRAFKRSVSFFLHCIITEPSFWRKQFENVTIRRISTFTTQLTASSDESSSDSWLCAARDQLCRPLWCQTAMWKWPRSPSHWNPTSSQRAWSALHTCCSFESNLCERRSNRWNNHFQGQWIQHHILKLWKRSNESSAYLHKSNKVNFTSDHTVRYNSCF